jgi:hypothetical protein
MDTRLSHSLERNAQDGARFDLQQGAVVIDARGLRFWAARGVQNLFVGVGRHFDFTCGVGGADRLYLRGAGGDHGMSVNGDELTLRHAALNTEVRLHATRGPRELVFDDGAVELGALWRSARDAAALLQVVGERSAASTATVANHVKCVRRRTVNALPPGALIQVDGPCGVETVYATGHGEASAPPLRVQLEGRLTEHAVALRGEALAVTRRASGLMHGAYVVGPAWLVFADGAVPAGALGGAVRLNQPWPAPSGPTLPALPRITAVALDVDAADIDWSTDESDVAASGVLPSGLFAGCRPGQVFEASVSLEVPVEVEGSPRLHLCVGGQHRAAQFSSGSGTSTLHFVYTVCEADVAHAAGSQTRGLTITVESNLDVDVGPVLTCGAEIRRLHPPGPSAVQQTALRVADIPDESTWQALITESERQVALALTRLEEQQGTGERLLASERTLGHRRLDVEIDLVPDIDLRELEAATETA